MLQVGLTRGVGIFRWERRDLLVRDDPTHQCYIYRESSGSVGLLFRLCCADLDGAVCCMMHHDVTVSGHVSPAK